MSTQARSLKCCVELFGLARLSTGMREVWLEVTNDATLGDLLEALGNALPALVGQAIAQDRTTLARGYVFNLNGGSFVDRLDIRIESGDRVLLLSDQAGG